MVTFPISQWSTSDLTGFLESKISRREQGCENCCPSVGCLTLSWDSISGPAWATHSSAIIFTSCLHAAHRPTQGASLGSSGTFLEHASSPGHSHCPPLSLPSPCSHVSPHPLPSLPWCWICLPPSPFTVPCPDGHGQFVFNSLNSHYTLPENFFSAWEWIEAKIGLCSRQSGQYQADERVESE